MDRVCSKGSECLYRHADLEEKKTEDCPYYDKGFCKLGLMCPFNHIARKICVNYLYGFCPKGPDCPSVHVKSVISENDSNLRVLANFEDVEFENIQPQYPVKKNSLTVRCHNCGEVGHKSTYC